MILFYWCTKQACDFGKKTGIGCHKYTSTLFAENIETYMDQLPKYNSKINLKIKIIFFLYVCKVWCT